MVLDEPSLLAVSWSPPASPNGIIRGYSVFYQEDDSRRTNQTWQTLYVNGSKHSVHVTRLTAFTKYTIQVLLSLPKINYCHAHDLSDSRSLELRLSMVVAVSTSRQQQTRAVSVSIQILRRSHEARRNDAFVARNV